MRTSLQCMKLKRTILTTWRKSSDLKKTRQLTQNKIRRNKWQRLKKYRKSKKGVQIALILSFKAAKRVTIFRTHPSLKTTKKISCATKLGYWAKHSPSKSRSAKSRRILTRASTCKSTLSSKGIYLLTKAMRYSKTTLRNRSSTVRSAPYVSESYAYQHLCANSVVILSANTISWRTAFPSVRAARWRFLRSCSKKSKSRNLCHCRSQTLIAKLSRRPNSGVSLISVMLSNKNSSTRTTSSTSRATAASCCKDRAPYNANSKSWVTRSWADICPPTKMSFLRHCAAEIMVGSVPYWKHNVKSATNWWNPGTLRITSAMFRNSGNSSNSNIIGSKSRFTNSANKWRYRRKTRRSTVYRQGQSVDIHKCWTWVTTSTRIARRRSLNWRNQKPRRLNSNDVTSSNVVK